jgi:pyruvate, water dikinase
MGFLGRFLRKEDPDGSATLKRKYERFRHLLAANNEMLEMITDLESVLSGGAEMTLDEVRTLATSLGDRVRLMVDDLNLIADERYADLRRAIDQIALGVEDEFRHVHGAPLTRPCIPLEELGREHADAVGGKAANLGEARNKVGLPVPAGFAVTSLAYRAFVEGSGLQSRLTERWGGIDWSDWRSVNEASAAMTALVQDTPIPREVAEEIALSAHDLYRKAHGSLGVAIRSSAIGEDGRATFAGQYATYLNIPIEQVLRRYKDVVASKFNPVALFYMHTHGFSEEEVAMSVGCFLMVDAVAAGVAYSVDPMDQALDKMLISAVWGLGTPVVNGTMTPDTYVVSRRPGRGIVALRPAHKDRRVVLAPKEGVIEEEVPAAERDRQCLTEEQIRTLAEFVRALEMHYRCPQDVEWALDRAQHFYILQTRPLRLADWGRTAVQPEAGKYPMLLHGGQTASPGVGSGTVVHADVTGNLSAFPQGGVLVARQTSPRFVEVMTRAAAIITDVGSPTGHMSSLAREYRVPTIVAAGVATALTAGVEVTVDATRCTVYLGRVEELLVESATRADPTRDSPALAVVERVVGRVARLNLTDPSKTSFRAKNCRTYHDVTRFCHEMAISEMFNLNDYQNLSDKGMAFRLQSNIPLGIYIIDLGGGLTEGVASRVVTPEQVTSIPMQALWRGMSTPGINWGGARPIDFKGFMSVWANTMYDSAKGERGLGANSYAIVASNYLNFGSRLGYHFTTMDSVCGDDTNDNYIIFRFKGGAADIDRRVRRTRFVAEVLSKHGLVIDQKADLLNAWIKMLPRPETEELLAVAGRVIGCARQLDVVMDAEATLDQCVASFMRGDFAFFDFKGQN